MRRALISLALVAWAVASVAAAELSQANKDFPNGPAGFLMTEVEKKAYALLKTDGEAQAWIELFWAKRDPDLNTVENEFRQEFDLKVAAADKMFSTEKVKGSMSDKGKVLIIMGKPLSARNVAAGAQGQEEEGARPTFGERGASQIWTYTKDGKPPAKKGDEILFVFTETRPGLGDFQLDRFDVRNRMSAKTLAAKVEELVRNPKLTEVPHVGLLPGTKAATAPQQAVFDVQPRPWPQEGAFVLSASGVKNESSHPIWLWVQLPNTVPPATQAIGRLRSADGGEVAGSFVAPAKPIDVKGARAYEFSLPAAAGAWKVDLALANEAGPVAVTTVDAKSEPAPADGPYLSPLFWGAEARPATAEDRLGDAFHLGGLHLLPRADHTYASTESLTYALYVTRPTLDAQGKPAVESRMALYFEGKEQDKQEFQATEGVKVIGDMWVFGGQIPLSGFRRGKQFELEVAFRDGKSGMTSVARIPLTVAKDETPAAAPQATAPPK
jgi:GWxTD domain-containing protein